MADCCEVLFAVLLPPLGVFLATGCGCDLLINILLCCLGWLPGIIHAVWVVASKTPKHTRVVGQPGVVVR
jgi:uncharacterized membrane protein YqaE (UPF0057 family)